jgi:hypothetical protein
MRAAPRSECSNRRPAEFKNRSGAMTGWSLSLPTCSPLKPRLPGKLIRSLCLLYARSNHSDSFLQTQNDLSASFNGATNRRCGAGTCNTPHLLLALALPDSPSPGVPLAGRLFLRLAGTEEWLTSRSRTSKEQRIGTQAVALCVTYYIPSRAPLIQSSIFWGDSE